MGQFPEITERDMVKMTLDIVNLISCPVGVWTRGVALRKGRCRPREQRAGNGRMKPGKAKENRSKEVRQFVQNVLTVQWLSQDSTLHHPEMPRLFPVLLDCHFTQISHKFKATKVMAGVQ